MPLRVFCAGRAAFVRAFVLGGSRFCTLVSILGSTAPLFYPVQLFYMPLASRVGVIHYQLHCLPACTTEVLQCAITATGSPVLS